MTYGYLISKLQTIGNYIIIVKYRKEKEGEEVYISRVKTHINYLKHINLISIMIQIVLRDN